MTMSKDGKITPKKLRHSFQYAISGLAGMLRREPNARIHCIITVLVVVAGFLFRISSTEWIGVVISIVALGLLLWALHVNPLKYIQL